MGESVPKKILNELFLEKMQNFFEVSRDGNTELKKGMVRPVQITVENRQGRKFVTRVNGLEDFGINPDALAQDLKIACAASSSVQQLPAKGAGKEVLVQGNVVAEVGEMLVEQFQIPKKYIETKDATKQANKK